MAKNNLVKFSIDLKKLSTVNYQAPAFSPLTDFLITENLIFEDATSLFKGNFQSNPVIIETCNRVPFRVACREIQILISLNSIQNVLHLVGQTRHPSLGIVTFAFQDIQLAPIPTRLSLNESLHCFASLLSVLHEIHQKGISHNAICHRSVLIQANKTSIVLGFFPFST